MNDFYLPIDRKLLKNRENTAMNKKVRLLLGTDFQEFTAQVSRHKNNLWFSLQSVRIGNEDERYPRFKVGFFSIN